MPEVPNPTWTDSRGSQREERSSRIRGDGVVAVIRRDDRYLVIRRAANLSAGGMWCFVGGAVEPGETQQQALVREVREEVGLEVVPVAKVWECLSLNREWRLHCWQAKPISESILANPQEVAAVDWLTPQQIVALPGIMPSVVEYFQTQNELQSFIPRCRG